VPKTTTARRNQTLMSKETKNNEKSKLRCNKDHGDTAGSGFSHVLASHL
jgi:hypothetical protein